MERRIRKESEEHEKGRERLFDRDSISRDAISDRTASSQIMIVKQRGDRARRRRAVKGTLSPRFLRCRNCVPSTKIHVS